MHNSVNIKAIFMKPGQNVTFSKQKVKEGRALTESFMCLDCDIHRVPCYYAGQYFLHNSANMKDIFMKPGQNVTFSKHKV